ncbi:MAG: hypothetical protein IJ678_05295, partial [Kiritimatiellae bacterium]|nr:hypothetical protein [Kiritimatiellia bacterium]
MATALQNALLAAGAAVVPLLSRRGELRLARAIAWFMCRPLFRFYRYARTNLDVAWGDSLSPEAKDRMLKESFRSAALVITDYFWFARRTEERLRRHVEVGDETMERWISGDFPGVFVTAHIGNWELAGLAIASRGRSLWSVFKPLGSAAVARRMRKFRGAGGQRVIPREGAM